MATAPANYPDVPQRSAKTFEESWAFPNDLKLQLGASSWKVERSTELYKSGRPIDLVTFSGVRPSDGGNADWKVVRKGMTLISKKGDPYIMCLRT